MTIKKAIGIGILGATIIGLVAFGIKHKSFSKENLTKTFTRTAIRVNADNEITNLTNTIWIIDEQPSFQGTDDTFYINFISNDTAYTEYTINDYTEAIIYNSTTAFADYSWTNNAYRQIKITSGTDVTNTDLINWLQQNATQHTLPPAEVTQEVIDIRGLMLQILTMPFTFITQAFDVTLWPNTEYEFNIGNFIMAIISIASILFIIKLFTSGFSIIGNYTGSRVDTKLKKSQIEYNKAKTDLARRTDPNTKTRINKKE